MSSVPKTPGGPGSEPGATGREIFAGGGTHLLSGRLLARNTIWNLLGQMLPMAVAVIAVPPLVRALGVPRFGVLSLALVIIGYFSFFDLGLGRAVTKLVADKAGTREEDAIPALAWTSLSLLVFLGIFGGVITSLISSWLVQHVLKIPRALQQEALESFWLLAASIPLVTATSGLRGILEAQQRFRIINLIRIPSSIFTYAGPLLVLPFSHSLVPVITVLLIGRLVTGVAHLLACLYAMPALRTSFSFDRAVIVPLMKFGGWITVSNVIGPLLTYIDRLLIGSLLSVSAVAFYSAPYDVVTRFGVIPSSVVGVLFPAFAMSFAQDAERTGVLLRKGTKYVFLAMFPIMLVIVALAPEGLRLWLGPAFVLHSVAPLRWLAAGVLINSLAFQPFVLIQGAGRPDLTAKLHLAETAPYLLTLWFLTTRFGITGTAVAWTLRVSVDAALLFLIAFRLLPNKARFVARLSAVVVGAIGVLYVAAIPAELWGRIAVLVSTLLVFAFVSWVWGLDQGEREYFLGRGKASAEVNARSGSIRTRL